MLTHHLVCFYSLSIVRPNLFPRYFVRHIPSNEELKITLWEQRATKFIYIKEGPYTIALLHSIISVCTFYNSILTLVCYGSLEVTQAYGGNACRWYFNPDIKEAQPLYNRCSLTHMRPFITSCCLLNPNTFFDMTNRLKHSPIEICTPTLQLPFGDETVRPIIIEHKTLHELNNIDTYEIPVRLQIILHTHIYWL